MIVVLFLYLYLYQSIPVFTILIEMFRALTFALFAFSVGSFANEIDEFNEFNSSNLITVDSNSTCDDKLYLNDNPHDDHVESNVDHNVQSNNTQTELSSSSSPIDDFFWGLFQLYKNLFLAYKKEIYITSIIIGVLSILCFPYILLFVVYLICIII